ncbi:MAG: rhodanese-like domain-containing protein, partial [Flavobacteriales bacterium]|nr:rhodanese-like domain-containing protein [Flavobacteriales bacterium]
MVHLRRLVLFFALASLIACASPKEEKPEFEAPLSEVPNDELWTIDQAKAAQGEVVFIDVRKEKDFVIKHIPGAKQVWRDDIQSNKYPYGGMAADRETISALFSKLGVESTSQVLLYDAKGGCDAARLW